LRPGTQRETISSQIFAKRKTFSFRHQPILAIDSPQVRKELSIKRFIADIVVHLPPETIQTNKDSSIVVEALATDKHDVPLSALLSSLGDYCSDSSSLYQCIGVATEKFIAG
jgi:hypothetical protein